jgi:hypothetical protein
MVRDLESHGLKAGFKKSKKKSERGDGNDEAGRGRLQLPSHEFD